MQYLLRMQNEEGRMSLILPIVIHWDRKSKICSTLAPFSGFLYHHSLGRLVGTCKPRQRRIGDKTQLLNVAKSRLEGTNIRNGGSTQLQTAEVYGLYSETLVRCLDSGDTTKYAKRSRLLFTQNKHSKPT